jgi:hypothetical protein
LPSGTLNKIKIKANDFDRTTHPTSLSNDNIYGPPAGFSFEWGDPNATIPFASFRCHNVRLIKLKAIE